MSERALAAGLCLLALTACQRERRQLRPAPAFVALAGTVAAQSDLRPGGLEFRPLVPNPYGGSAFAISAGQLLFDQFNCSGCHARGGGGIGPPLIKGEWIYGNQPENLFETIVKGRPNGMPAWGGRIPDY